MKHRYVCGCGRVWRPPLLYPNQHLDFFDALYLYNKSGWYTVNEVENGFIVEKTFCPECIKEGKDK